MEIRKRDSRRVGARHRGKVIIVRLLNDIEDRCGNNHGLRRIVYQDHDISLQDSRRGRSPARSVNLNFGKWVIPFPLVDALGQALLVHGQGIYPDRADSSFQLS